MDNDTLLSEENPIKYVQLRKMCQDRNKSATVLVRYRVKNCKENDCERPLFIHIRNYLKNIFLKPIQY